MKLAEKYIIYSGIDKKIYAQNGDSESVEFSSYDASVVIQYALNKGGRIFVKDSIYDINSTIFYNKDDIFIEGESHNTVFKLGNNVNMDVLSSGRRNNAKIILKNFRIDGNRDNNVSGRGLVFTGYYSSIDNIYITNCSGNGFDAEVPVGEDESVVDNFIRDIRISGCGGTGFIWGTNKGGECSDNYFQNIISWYNKGDGIDIRGSDNSIFMCHPYSNSGNGIVIRDTLNNIYNGYSEHNGKNGFWILDSGGWHTTLTGCTAWNNSLEGTGKYHGFNLDGISGNWQKCILLGCYAYDTQENKTQGWGVTNSNVGSGTKNIVIGGDFVENLIGAINVSDNLRAKHINDPIYENKGLITFSGTGKKTQFSFPHGIVKTPTNVQFEAKTAAASGNKYWKADSTNITIIFMSAPVVGTNNIVIGWRAEV